MTSLHELVAPGSPRVRERIDAADLDSIVAEDQATVFGFACTHTPALMPLPIWLAHKVARRLAAVSHKELPYLSPDGKTQVAVELQGGRPIRIFGLTILAGSTADNSPPPSRLHRDVCEIVIDPAFTDEPIRPDDRTRIMINPEGSSNGGPAMHAGLTGRKTADDTYGGFARQSGAALSGKDMGRIDRIGAYAARYVAKNVVAAELAQSCEVQLSYSIGLAGPVSVHVDTFGTGALPDDEIDRRVEAAFDLRVGAIVRDLRLRQLPRPQNGELLEKLAAYGHVGRPDLALPWEATDRIERLRG
jgi:S-adenosylmethionine synthetase